MKKFVLILMICFSFFFVSCDTKIDEDNQNPQQRNSDDEKQNDDNPNEGNQDEKKEDGEGTEQQGSTGWLPWV